METDAAPSQASERQCHPGTDASDPITVGQRIDRICDAAGMAIKSSRDVVSEVSELLDIDGRVNRNPYAMMAAAAGTGYVLGGGLFSPLTARILNLSLRVGLRLAAASPLIQCKLSDFATAACENCDDSGSPRNEFQPSNVMKQGSCYDEPESSKTRR